MNKDYTSMPFPASANAEICHDLTLTAIGSWCTEDRTTAAPSVATSPPATEGAPSSRAFKPITNYINSQTAGFMVSPSRRSASIRGLSSSLFSRADLSFHTVVEM